MAEIDRVQQNPYFQKILADFKMPQIPEPEFQSPWADYAGAIQNQQPFQGAGNVDPNVGEPEGMAPPPASEPPQPFQPIAPNLLMARDIVGPDEEHVKPAPTPWVARVLGGLQDALAIMSAARKGTPVYQQYRVGGHWKKRLIGYSPVQSNAQFGGLAMAMLSGKRAADVQNALIDERNRAKRDQMAKIGQAIALTAVEHSMDPTKKSPGDLLAEHIHRGVTEGWLSREDAIGLNVSFAKHLAGIKDTKFAGKTYVERRAKLQEEADAGDEDAKSTLELLDQAEAHADERKVKVAGKIASTTLPAKKELKSAPGAQEPGEGITTKEARTIKEQTEELEKKNEQLRSDLKPLKAFKAKMEKFAPELVDNEAIAKIEKEIAANEAEIKRIKAQVTPAAVARPTETVAPPPAGADGWGTPRVKK
jgi:hypothetical protein